MRPRLFVDMDGTLAEWRSFVIRIDKAEDAEQTEFLKRLDAILYSNHYYYNLRPQMRVVDAIRNIVLQGEIEVFVLSCVKEDKYGQSPRKDKDMWLNKYLPEIDTAHRIYVPDGEDKTLYIPGGIQPTDALLDDYSKNLRDWEARQRINGRNSLAIKLCNAVNSSKGTWKGNRVSYAFAPTLIAEDVSDVVRSEGFIEVHHEEPEKHREGITDEEFLANVPEGDDYE